MKAFAVLVVGSLVSLGDASAQDVVYSSTLADQSVDTREFSIQLSSAGDEVHFLITLHNKETGFERKYEFEGEGATDPAPFQLAYMHYCGTMTILLTVEYPWRHALPQYVRVLSTFAFRESDFDFIDVAFGPLTDIALQDSTYPEELDPDMLPPIGVRCLSEPDGKPFEFVEPATK